MIPWADMTLSPGVILLADGILRCLVQLTYL